MSWKRKHRGLTLIEVLVAAALSGVLLTILVKILVPGLQIWRHTQAVSELEQNAMIARAKIEAAMQNTCADSITTIDQPSLQAVSFLDNEGTESQQGYDSDGRSVWQSMAIFAVNPSEGKLREIRWDGGSLPTTDTFAFTPPELIAGAANEGKLVAGKVTSFRVLSPPPDQKIWQIQMTLQTSTPRGIHKIERELNVMPRIQEL